MGFWDSRGRTTAEKSLTSFHRFQESSAQVLAKGTVRLARKSKKAFLGLGIEDRVAQGSENNREWHFQQNRHHGSHTCAFQHLASFFFFFSVTKRLTHAEYFRVQPPGQEDPWRREYQPTPVFLPVKSTQGQKILAGYRPQGHKASDMTERLSTFSTHTYMLTVLVLLYLLTGRCKTWGPLKWFIWISKHASKPPRANILGMECFPVFSTLNSLRL